MAMRSESVFSPAPVDATLPDATPLASVTATGCVTVFPAPVAAMITVGPATGLPCASGAVTVTVLVPLPATMLSGAIRSVDVAPETVPAETVRPTVDASATPSIVAETVFDFVVASSLLVWVLWTGVLPGLRLPEIPAFEISFAARHPWVTLAAAVMLGIVAILLALEGVDAGAGRTLAALRATQW